MWEGDWAMMVRRDWVVTIGEDWATMATMAVKIKEKIEWRGHDGIMND